jgi:hypothetical protein
MMTTPVHTDAWGRTYGGWSTPRRIPVSRVETSTGFYELEWRGLQVGQTIDFRIDGGHAFVRREGGKERRYWVVGVELKQNKENRDTRP